VRRVKEAARQQDRALDVFTAGVVTCRPTRQEAEAYDHYATVENADLGAIDHILAMRGVTPDKYSAEEFATLRRKQAYGMGGVRLVGTPDEITQDLAALSEAGIAGIALSFVHYIDELPYFCAEVLPRLARLGLRSPA